MWSRILVLSLLITAGAAGDDAPASRPARPRPKHQAIDELAIDGTIDGKNITFTLACDVDHRQAGKSYPLISGDVVLDTITATGGRMLRYDPATKTYHISWKDRGTYHVKAAFAARSGAVGKDGWRETSFTVPSSRVRKLSVACDRTDLEIRFPGALRVEKTVADKTLTVTAILGPGKPFAVAWKPQVRELGGELVMASRVNTIASVSPSSMRLDNLFVFDISQGTMKEMTFAVPPSLSITQVRGEYISTWQLTAGEQDRPGRLSIALNKPQEKQYAVRILAETPLDAFPANLAVPVVTPEKAGRTGGHLVVGTDSAIKLVVGEMAGLSQVEGEHFPRLCLDRARPRRIPAANAFFYSFASCPYTLQIRMDDIVPAYDALHKLTVSIREDDLVIEDDLELDIRDAPLREVSMHLPEAFVVASLAGPAVDDYSIDRTGGRPTVRIHFARPVSGRTLITLRAEMGHSPLGAEQALAGLAVEGAGTERGYIAVAAEQGVQIDAIESTDLREVHTGSIPLRVPDARNAFRFRSPDWTLSLTAVKKTSSLQVEAFHLLSLGEGVCYGSVAVSYYISGAPVDEFRFTVPADVNNVEFVGRDVRRWEQKEGEWIVTLSRKVIGDYNLAVMYTSDYAGGKDILAGGVDVCRAETRRGFIVLASHLNLHIDRSSGKDGGTGAAGLIEIGEDELPANYRLLVNAPIMKTWKYVGAPHEERLAVRSFERGELLSAVVELMKIETDINVADDDTAESVTRVRYKVKNSSRQFLSLKMPAGAAVWSTHLVRNTAGGDEERRRVMASFDKKNHQLLVPLERKANPNEPVTVDLVYARSHGTLGFLGRLDLRAPSSDVETSYACWQVRGPDDRTLFARGGTMPVRGGTPRSVGLPAAVVNAGHAWLQSFRGVLAGPAWIGILVCAVPTLVLVGVWKPGALGLAAVVLLVLVAAGIGVFAAASPGFAAGFTAGSDTGPLEFSRPLSLDDGKAPAIGVSAIPDWRAGLTRIGVVLLCGGLVCAVIALLYRKHRTVPAALAVALLVWGGAEIGPVGICLGHVFTWGIPAAIAGILTWRLLLKAFRAGGGRVAAAAGGLLLVLAAAGCEPIGGIALSPDKVLDSVVCTIEAEKDSCSVDYALRVAAAEPMEIKLAGPGTVLMSDAAPTKQVRLYTADGLWILIREEGIHEFNVSMLVPLPEAGPDMSRTLSVPLPAALTNSVRLKIPRGGIDVTAPAAARFNQREAGDATVAEAIFAPGEAARFTWKPRARRTELEDTVFFAETDSLLQFDAARAVGLHRLRLQIAQGQLDRIEVVVPENMTVTEVSGQHLGTWRYDPDAHTLEARLNEPVAGSYLLAIKTHTTGGALPWTVRPAVPAVKDAQRQHGTIGLVSDPAVYLKITDHPQKMNAEDFVRIAGSLLKASAQSGAGDVRYAYRVRDPAETVNVEVFEVLPEIRTACNGTFSISDERLVFNGTFAIDVSKAGIFSAHLLMPAAYDIDTLTAPQVSHWDETVEDGIRAVQVHFKKKHTGAAELQLSLSRPVPAVPEQIAVPRIEVRNGLKHTGQVIISPERGLRVSVAEGGREKVSEVNPAEVGIRAPNTLVYRFLGPDWKLVLDAEAVEPRIIAEALHVAAVSEALVRHTHYIRYRLEHAGSKVFSVRVPSGALGLVLTGPDIANTRLADAATNTWRVELTRKRFDRPYPLTVRYETRFGMDTGDLPIEPVIPLGCDLYRGNVAVKTTEKVELTAHTVGPALRPGDPRNIDRMFGAGDLSSAVFTWHCPVPGYTLTLNARRHEAADLLEADVLQATITSVVNTWGQSINRVNMDLRVGSKRHLGVRLPDGSRTWSLMVNGRAVQPSREENGAAGRLLVPLLGSGGGSGERDVHVDLIYVSRAPSGWDIGEQSYAGPRFDLPLRNVRWVFYLPEHLDYDDFAGTMNLDEDTLDNPRIARYDIDTYEKRLQMNMVRGNRQVRQMQEEARQLVARGEQQEAKQTLVDAFNNPYQEFDLNEDIRVELHNLNKQQAMVGLKGRRYYIRPNKKALSPRQSAAGDLGGTFTEEQARRELSALDKADSENLDIISTRIIDAQEVAAGAAVPLTIQMPERGVVVELTRPLQVKPNSEMKVTCRADTMPGTFPGAGVVCAAGVFVAALLLICFGPRAADRAIVAAGAGREARRDDEPERQEEETPEERPAE